MMDLLDIHNWLQHRYPMLLVDKVIELKRGQSIVAIKAITGSEFAYTGRSRAGQPDDFPFPPPLILESFCQSAALLANVTKSPQMSPGHHVPLLGGVYDCVFLGSAYPGDVLTHHVHIQREYEDSIVFEGEVMRQHETIARLDCVIIAMKPIESIRNGQGSEKVDP